MASVEKSLGSKKPEKKKSKKKSAKKHKIRRMTIEPADNGGFMVRHEHHPDEPDGDEPGSVPPDETHALGDENQLLSHVQGTFGGSPDAGAGPAAGAAGPGAGAPPAAQGM